MGGMRRGGVQLLLLILPDGSRSLIPAEWTDWQADDAAGASASSVQHAGPCLIPLAGLLHVRLIVNALLQRGPIPRLEASSHEESYAAGPCPSRTSPAAAGGCDRYPSLPDSARDSCAHPRSSRRGGKARGARQ